MKRWTRWQDWVIGIVGIWFLAFPWILSFSDNPSIMWTGVVLGVLMAGMALWALASPGAQLAEWSNIVLGVLAFISPWVLTFAAERTAAWNAWIVGVVAVLAAAWALPKARLAHEEEHTPGKHRKAG